MDDVEALIEKAANQPMAGPLVRDLVDALATLRDRLAAAERGQKEAIAQMCKTARELGEAQGKLAASELPGIIDGWRERALDAERERDEWRKDAQTTRIGMIAWQYAATRAESRVTRLTEALKKAREYVASDFCPSDWNESFLTAIDAALKGEG
jgi:hypothetical protein